MDSPSTTAADTTRFGASWVPLERSAAVLRARTSRHGVNAPVGASPVCLAASVVAVEVWMAALGAASLETPTRFGPDAIQALAASLALLTADTPGAAQELSSTPTAPDELFMVVEDVAARVRRWGLRVDEVLAMAAQALSAGAGNRRLAAAAGVLMAAADTAVPAR